MKNGMRKYPFLTLERRPYQLMNHYSHVDLELPYRCFSVSYLSRIVSSFQGLFDRMAFRISGGKALRRRLLVMFSNHFWSLCFRGMQSHDLPAMPGSMVLDLCQTVEPRMSEFTLVPPVI